VSSGASGWHKTSATCWKASLNSSAVDVEVGQHRTVPWADRAPFFAAEGVGQHPLQSAGHPMGQQPQILWLLTAAGPQAPHASSNAVWAARQAGVRHIVRMSAIGAAHDAPTRNGRLHAVSDAELQASGIPYTIIKPAAFMQILLGSVAGGTLYHNWGEGRVGFIDAADIAAFAAQILTEPDQHASQTYTITGPTSLSMAEVAATITDAIGNPIRPQPIPTEAALAGMIQAGLPEWASEVAAREYATAYAGGWGDFTTPDFAAVTGRTARSVADFARDHAGLHGDSNR